MSKAKPTIPRFYLGAFKIGHRRINKPFIDESLSYKLLSKILASKIANPAKLDSPYTEYQAFTNNYADKESIKALEYLTKFNNEFYQARAPKNDTPLHTSPEHKKANNDANNARRRDIMSREYNYLVSIDGDCIHGNGSECNTSCSGVATMLSESEKKALF